MTREEAIDYLRDPIGKSLEVHDEAVSMAIAALSQEPCEDAVSRESVKDLAHQQIRNEYAGMALKERRDYLIYLADTTIDTLPSVTPKRMRGRWIKAHGYVTGGGDPVWQCSQCGKGLHVYGIEHYANDVTNGQWKACPNCGAEMEGEE